MQPAPPFRIRPRWRTRSLGRVVVSALAFALAGLGAIGGAGFPAAASSSATPGVTATTIKVGIPYPDLDAVRQFGVTLDQGSFPDAYNALIANLNTHGGIDGRKVVLYLVGVNPVGPAPAATACTQLAADDEVLVAIAPQEPNCYVQQYGIPTISGTLQDGVQTTGAAPNFSLQPPAAAYDPLQLSVLAHKGVFKGKKVGLFAGQSSDGSELHVVEASLKSLRVPVVESAVDAAPIGDEAASNQQATAIAQRFKSDGVNEVVAVGSGATVWPESLQNAQSSYNPSWVATNEGDVAAALSDSSITPPYLKDLVTTTSVPSKYEIWQEPAVQQCYRIIRKAYPSDKITPPSSLQTGSDQTSFSVESACSNVAMLTAILKSAGKNLSRSSFAHAGYELKNVDIPGSGQPVSFTSSRPYDIGTVYLVTYRHSEKGVGVLEHQTGK